MRNRIKLQKGNKKLINAWAFYDWANSVYPLVITSTVFPIYYTTISDDITSIEFLGYHFKNTALISFVTAMAFVVVAFNSPILSGIADYVGNKKRFMKIFVLFSKCLFLPPSPYARGNVIFWILIGTAPRTP